MLTKLIVNNFYSGTMPDIGDEAHFVLKTCQRTLVVSHACTTPDLFTDSLEQKQGKEAYNYLLQVICGLQSKLIGENEIVSQFKVAYKEYLLQKNRNTTIMAIIEKLFADAKEIRSKYLLGLSQRTYSAITRKEILSHSSVESVLILGSGSLAEDMINQLKKKTTVYISARNTIKVEDLTKLHGVEVVDWKNVEKYKNFPYIINTIGCEHKIFKDDFFIEWKASNSNRKFIDLGSPSTIETPLTLEDGVMRLDQICQEGTIHEEHKINQIEKAKIAMDGLVEKRYTHMKNKINANHKR
jgi:glutamyl-tRNA reductase